MAAVAGNFLLVLLTTCLPLSVLAAYYPSHWYLKDNCGANRVFSRNLVLGYSYKRYSTLLRNWDCPLTLRTADPTRGIQVHFRYLDTTQSDDCNQARLTVSDTHGPLTYSDGVCGKSSPSVLRTQDNTVHISLSTGSFFFNYGDFELLLTEFTYSKNGACDRNDFRCSNGICISADLKCNGYNDCDDESDERGDCGLEKGAIIGIAIGVVCFVLLVCFTGVLCRRRGRSYVRIEQAARLESSAPYPTMKGEFTGYPQPQGYPQPLPPPPPYPGNSY